MEARSADLATWIRAIDPPCPAATGAEIELAMLELAHARGAAQPAPTATDTERLMRRLRVAILKGE